MSTNVLDVDNGIDWLDIVENTAIISAKIKHVLTVLFDRTAVHLEPEYSICMKMLDNKVLS